MTTRDERRARIEKIRLLPEQLEKLVAGLSHHDLHSRFIAGEWTVAQNVHHLADSHMNAFIRLKLILTEDRPALKPYQQDNWAATADARDLPVDSSLALLTGLHARWVALWESLADADWSRTGLHPEVGTITPDDLLRTYSGHGEAHLEQIRKTLAARS